MSAQETVCGQMASTCALMLSMTLKPLMDPAFGNAVCSPVKVAVSFSSTEASQPWSEGALAWTKQSWKCSLSSEAPMRASCATAASTPLLMVDSALGHDVS
ncbi:hypothetical protein U9M48_016208 [Paspalum notatum var. saurae]|uniref:Uncharacterized protein n=1 Tax=Paspalum notatum var. saurae TaxID=547442 RepID=A0AAQ3T6J7_PASNO